MDAWKHVLQQHDYPDKDIHALTYQSLTNEVTIGDIAEGFDRALNSQIGLNDNEDFDVIAHSTGMLVLRLAFDRLDVEAALRAVP